MAANMSEYGAEYNVQTEHSSTQKATMPAKSQKIGGEYEEQSSSGQKASRPADELEDITMTNSSPIREPTQGQSSDVTNKIQSVDPKLLRSADNRQGKTIKRGKASIQDYGATTNRLGKDPANAQVRLQSIQNQLNNTKEQLAVSKKNLKTTKAQLQSNRKELAACRRNLKASKSFGRNLQAKDKVLQKCLTDTRAEMTRCKDDLFGLQAVTQTPDCMISKLFDSLCQYIVQWIDVEIAAFEKVNGETNLDPILSAGEDKEAISFLRLHPHAGEHLARYLIHRFLQDNIFGKKVYFFGLPDEIAQLLRKVEHNMAQLDPPRDSGTISAWRSETFKALAKTTECADYANIVAKDLNSRLFKELSKALPSIFSGQEAHITFYDQVLLPAVRLANTMQMSSSDYNFSIPGSLATRFKPFTRDLLKVHTMVDSKSGRPLKPDSALIADKEGIIGEIVICLEPGLYRMISGKEPTLRQEVFLVELKHPLGKRSKASV